MSRNEDPVRTRGDLLRGKSSGSVEQSQGNYTLSDGTIAIEKFNDLTSGLYALVIGINDYPNLSKLKGAVADADEVAHFLQYELKVPSEHVRNLRDETATRQNIIDAIRALRNNQQIKKGDPILIYYAGHGGLRDATDEWKRANGAHVVQVIFPYDYDSPDTSSEPIQCIPDRTIAGMLNELSIVKGDNVTVIFDSCHSASGTRESSKPRKGVIERRERSEVVKRDIPWSIDTDIVDPGRGLVPPPKEEDETRHTSLPLCANQTSHIHLAACGSEEKAWEEDGRGVFTMALLKAIRANGVDKITYHNLVKSLPSFSSQSPHCYGINKERILFNSTVPSHSTLMIPVKLKAETMEVVLKAGAASGVTTGSIWEIFHSATGDISLGTFQAEPPLASTTVLKPQESGGDELFIAYIQGEDAKSRAQDGVRPFARQVKAGVINELRVYMNSKVKESVFPARETNSATYSVGSGDLDVGYVVHENKDTADVALDIDVYGMVFFTLCDRQAEMYKVNELMKRVRQDRSAVEEILFAAAKWKWHLHRENADSWEITNRVTMELVTIGKKPGRDRVFYPESERKSINEFGIVEFDVERQNLYGIRLTSQVDKPLYVRMFYFDTTDFSISDMFGHSVGKDPTIRPKGTFTIGDGGDGGTPLQFTLMINEKLDLGYMKVFWSTKPLRLEGLGQKPVFNRLSRKWNRLRGCELDVDDSIEWGTAFLTLVQRSPPR